VLAEQGEGASVPAGRALPRVALLSLATWLSRVVLLVASVALVMTVRSYFLTARDARLPDVAVAGVVLLGLLGQAGISLIRDVALADVVARGTRPAAAVSAALRVLRHRGLGLAGRYALTSLAALALLAGSAALVSALDVAQAATWRSATAAAAHQGAIIALISLRAVWLWGACRAAAAAPPEPAPHAEAFL
jgi:hypothetical protein